MRYLRLPRHVHGGEISQHMSLGSMINALGLEAAAIREKGGGARVALRGGERVGQAQGSWLYRFIVGDEVNRRDDTPVQVTAGQEDVQGVLVSFPLPPVPERHAGRTRYEPRSVGVSVS